MEGRRVSRKNAKYNPLFILFLCLVAAVLILLVVSIVLGLRLGKANKKLKATEQTVKELTAQVTQLESDLDAAKSRAASPAAPVTPGSTQPALPSSQTTPAKSDDWLDLTGHSEVEVKPKELLDGYATYYTTAGVNLRSGPATSYKRITTIDYGEKVEVAAKEGGWSFAKVGGKFGWISSDYLSTSQPAPQTARRTEATSGSARR